jgi:chromosome segregation ATPase
VTLIPLDQIESKKIPPQVMTAAKRVARTTHLAQDLLDYDRRDQPAVQFAFWQTVICDSPDEAKALAFSKNLVENKKVFLRIPLCYMVPPSLDARIQFHD